MNSVKRCVFLSVLIVAFLSTAAIFAAETRGSGSAGNGPGLVVKVERGITALSLEEGNPFHSTANQVTQNRLISVPGRGRQVALWNEVDSAGGVTPFYAIEQGGEWGRAIRTSYLLKIRHGEFDPSVAMPGVEDSFESKAGSNLYIVQFETQPLDEYRATIKSLGGHVQSFLASNSHIVQMDLETRNQVSALSFVRWVGPFHPAYRLERFLLDNRDDLSKAFPTQRYNILVFESGEAGKPVVAGKIKAIGGRVDSADSGKYLLDATLTSEQLFQVIQWDEVQYVDRWSPLEKDMDIVRELQGANYLETVAGYTGAGVRAEIFDLGFNVAHPDFASRPLIEHGTVNNDSHGTACAGINFGDGAGDIQARGLMPDGQGIVADLDDVGLTGSNRYDHTGELNQAPYFAVFQTSSVGSARTFFYTTISADHDTLLFDWDVLHCQSQSNAGNQDSRPQAWSKNVVSGGAFNHFNTADRSDDCWSCGSASIGPASDGRIKPDLSFFYDLTYTTYTTGSGYGEFGGTSGATPSICGYFGLFFEMWSDGIFGNEVDPGGTVFDNRPHMTTAKAFMINTASQHPFTGTTHDMTRVHQGWGMPDIRNVYDMRDDISFIDESILLTNMETIEFNALVGAGSPAMRVTLTYADPAGNPASTQHRINDLTLKVTSPSEVVYWGNNGLLEGNWSIAGGAADTIDTVENVFIENPEEGNWIVEITASEINQDGHVETPELDADFALVVSGAFMSPCSSDGRAALNRNRYTCEADAGIRVVDCDLNTDDSTIQTVSVTVTSESEPTGETVILTETGPATATFLSTIALSETDGAGVLQIADTNTVTLEYIDADDGKGGTNISKIDQAVVDCSAPVISNVQAINVEARSASITFDTDETAEGAVRYGLACGSLTETQSMSGLVTAHSINVSGLADNTIYFYAVDAVDEAGNVAGNDNSGACYSFTTPEIPDFFTELFPAGNDTDFLRLAFTPVGGPDFYAGCTSVITSFPTDPAGGTTLSLTDDSFATVTLTGGNTVSLYGVSYSTFYVSSNGYITFNSGATDYTETLAEHFNQPRISAVYDDLNPADTSSPGTVSWKELSDRVVVTWDGVTEYSPDNTNDFQIEMFFSGVIAINYLTVDVNDGLAGISEGNGLSPDYFDTDLSAMASCGAESCFDGILNQDEVRIDCGGVCAPCECLSDPECDDGQFCTGADICDARGQCAAGPDPCPGEACHEGGDVCVECLSDVECDDGLYCNGTETCSGNSCQSGLGMCPYGICDEGTDTCITCDNDGTCEPGEDCANCPGDCISGSNPVCGNGICEVADGEDCLTCPDDCNGLQTGGPSLRYCCGDGIVGQGPVTCADARCNAGGNTCAVDPVLAYCCGDATCGDIETIGNCEADCTPTVPGEAGSGGQLLVTGFDPVTGVVSISYGVPCAAADHTIEYGELTQVNLQSYAWGGQECGLGASGVYDWSTAGTPDAMFFVVVANNGTQEGSYGKDGTGLERSEDSISVTCPTVQNMQYTCE